MGSPVSPIVVNLYMEKFEQRALDSYPGTKPRVWKRHVDDTFVIINNSELSTFFEHINNVDPNIKFTKEEASDNQLPFLDSGAKIEPNRKLSSNV